MKLIKKGIDMSKGLEALERLENDYEVKGLTLCSIIRKELKALEILRECNLTIDEFNKKFDFISGKVPKDKVGLLKEVLKK